MRSQKTVVIIDDHADSRQIYRMYLEAEGYRVRTADNGTHGRELLRGGPPDAVLLDRLLPDMDGLELLRDLDRGKTCVIALTAVALPDQTAEALAAGCRSCLVKPVRPRDVARELERLLGTAGDSGSMAVS